jgi:uncharacterized protein (DUF1684 family)
MGRRNVRSSAAALALVLSVSACGPQPFDENDYIGQLTAERTAKDRFLDTSSDSPIPADRKTILLPLPYFPVDPAFNVPAELRPSGDQTVIDMPTSTGQPEKYRRAGTLTFTLQGQELTLTAFVQAAARNVNSLFVPFRDLTSGKQTYPAGRYLDLERTETGFYELDFNRAYNPYCYYNVTYTCPLPPPENHLQLAIPVGERLSSKEAT